MIKAKDIIKSYGNGESRFQVLKGISLDIEDNDFVVILGASGSGKSTFLNVISGLERPDSGNVSYDRKDITALSDKEATAFRKENVEFILKDNLQTASKTPNHRTEKNRELSVTISSSIKGAVKAGVFNSFFRSPFWVFLSHIWQYQPYCRPTCPVAEQNNILLK